MANKKNTKDKEPAKRPASSPPRNPIYMAAVGLLAGGWIIWRLEPSWGLGLAVLAGALIFGAWLVFVFLMNRSYKKGNDD
jgi:hypothetical protein